METKELGFRSRCIHAGEPAAVRGAVTLPIFQSSTYEYGGESDYNDIRYIRLNNSPNHQCVAEKIASIEGGEACVVAASGMAAITTTLMQVVGVGETLLAQENLYGGTHHFLSHDFAKFARNVIFFDPHDDGWMKLVNPSVRAIYIESVSNPLLRVPSLKRVASQARSLNLLSVVDNTFPSPVNCNPIGLGFDLVVHSATKYLNGHTDIVAGCVVGTKTQIAAITKLLNHLGGCLDPHACFLLNRGLKTLSLRVGQQNSTAMSLAQYLQTRVETVYYPGLPNHRDHELARELLRGFGGVVSFEYPGLADEADAFLSRLRFAHVAPSLGGVETLVTRPVTTSHSGVSPHDRRRLGLSDNLIRISVGLEDEADLVADFERALR